MARQQQIVEILTVVLISCGGPWQPLTGLQLGCGYFGWGPVFKPVTGDALYGLPEEISVTVKSTRRALTEVINHTIT